MTSNWKNDCDYLGVLELSGAAAEHVGDGEKMPTWSCWLSKGSPKEWQEGFPNEKSRYASWVNGLDQKGLYLWLQPRPGNRLKYRFVHVGIAGTGGKGGSTLGRRTKVHCANQLKSRNRDRIHRLEDGCKEFGSLGQDLRDAPNWAEVANQFLRDLRILFICADGIDPRSPVAGRQIRSLEGLIAHAAEDAFGPGKKEITNMLIKTTSPPKNQPDVLRDVRIALNKLVEIFPQ